MRRIIVLFTLLAMTLLTACAVPNDTTKETAEEMIEKEIEEINDKEIENENEENNDEEIKEENENNNDTVTEDNFITEEIKVDTGRFSGLVDANSFEVKISGVPDVIAYKIFMLTDDVREDFEDLNFQEDDEIRIYYYETPEGQLIITEIEKI